MSDTPGQQPHGPLLAAYLKSLIPAHQSVRAFCLEHGLDNQRVSAWESARDVSIDSMRDFGEKFALTLGQVLVIAGYGTPDDFGGATPPVPKPPAPPNVVEAINHDPSLSDGERAYLQAA